MADNLTIGSLLGLGLQRLHAVPPSLTSAASARLDAELLLSETLGLSRARLRSHPEHPVEPDEARRYMELVERRATGEPVAYLLGRREFWSLSLTVSPAVLVPRPETELLVERALQLWSKEACRVADLGTGSGAIALALAKERPHWSLVGIDISAPALAIARANATALGLGRVELLEGNWFAPLAGRRFHLILSNPPYVAASDPALQEAALKHEPALALTPGEDAMACLRSIACSAPEHLERRGWLLLEHGAGQAADVASELVARGFRHVRSHRDLAGYERMTEGQWLPT
jgi:release factor glutamine methyltransferase